MNRFKKIAALVASVLMALGLATAVASPASAAVVHGTSVTASGVVLGETDPAKLPVGVSVTQVVSPALGGCLDNEICVWTDSLGPSQPAGFLYRWGIGFRGTTIFIGPGTFYHTVSFMQNRQAQSRARAQTSCPGIFTDPTGPWLYDEQYSSFAGKLINDGAACIISQWV